MSYDPADWYWDNGTQLFSSARQAAVPYADAAYQAWRARGNAPTRHPGDVALRAVLAPFGAGLSPQETAKLQAFQGLATDPWRMARAYARLVMLLVTKGVLTRAQALDLLATDEQSDPGT